MRFGLCTLALLALAGCSASRTCLSPEAQALAGDRAAPRVEARFGGICADPAAEQRMARIAARLHAATPDMPSRPQVQLVRSARPNACSLPGPRVYITRGLYDVLGDEAELAAVIAHELSHVATGDHFKPRCGCLRKALVREQAADAGAARYLQAAGYDVAALSRVIAHIADMQPTGWAEARQAAIADLPCATDNVVAAARWR